MGNTAFQKIVNSHLLRVLSDGSLVLRLDRLWGHELTTPNAILDMRLRGCDVVFNPNRIKTIVDHVNPAKDTASAMQGQLMREWSKFHGVEFFDVGRNGVCHALIPEKGLILPGEIGIMGDSHTCTHGAFCALTAGVGTTELENGIITGLWICPPQKVIRVNFVGKLPANVFAKDLVLKLINKIGVKGATNAVLEFGGNVVEKMGMEGRMTIANMAVEAGATSGMMMVDQEMIDYIYPALIKEGGYNSKYNNLDALAKIFNSDSDAEYDQVIDIYVSDMVPVMTNNYSPGDVVNVSAFAGKKVDQVYIGSCTNGRISDLRAAANVFKTMGKVSDKLRCIVVPATQHIYEMALQEGLIEIFAKAGCFVSGPTCGACLGMSCGVLAPGEVCVSTTNRNFPGRMGKDGMVHLASPATAAYTAIHGVITKPPINLCEFIIEGELHAPVVKEVILTDWEDKDFVRPNYTNLFTQIGGGTIKNFSGNVFYLPADDVDTDQIIPAKYLTETDLVAFGHHCLEGVEMTDNARRGLREKQILIAGKNFGCGSSREHAVWALSGAGIQCVIAPSFARIFEQNMFANGLLCITLPEEDVAFLMKNGSRRELIINVEEGIISGDFEKVFSFKLSKYQRELIGAGGSVGVMLKLAAELQAEGKI